MSLAIYVGLFSIWQALLPTWVNFVYDWAILHGTKWAKNKTTKKPYFDSGASPEQNGNYNGSGSTNNFGSTGTAP